MTSHEVRIDHRTYKTNGTGQIAQDIWHRTHGTGSMGRRTLDDQVVIAPRIAPVIQYPRWVTGHSYLTGRSLLLEKYLGAASLPLLLTPVFT
jgi:hypothetical protein